MRDPSPFSWPRLAEDGVTELGIDLASRAHEVRKLVLAGFRPPADVDVEDLIQDVLLAIHRKNRQGCAFDPRRAGFAKYVHRVANSALCNAIQALRRNGEPLASLENLDVADPSDRTAALDDADEATANLGGSRELGAAIPRAPVQLWRIALDAREAEALEARREAAALDAAQPWQIVMFARDRPPERKRRPSARPAQRERRAVGVS